jgi:hypothetical protein
LRFWRGQATAHPGIIIELWKGRTKRKLPKSSIISITIALNTEFAEEMYASNVLHRGLGGELGTLHGF